MLQLSLVHHLCAACKISYIFRKTLNEIQIPNDFGQRIKRYFVSLQVCVICMAVFLWLYVCVCVTTASYVCVHVNPQRHKAPMPLCSCQHPPTPPSRLWLGRSWGLTFHFSDPLFHRANSYAGLEMCYVAG